MSRYHEIEINCLNKKTERWNEFTEKPSGDQSAYEYTTPLNVAYLSSQHTPQADRRTDMRIETFFGELVTLVRRGKSSDNVMVVAHDFDAQFGKLGA